MNDAELLARCGGRRPAAVPTIEAIYAAGHWLLEQERFADAASVFRVMLHAAPTDERCWLGLGECHERIDQPRIALELYGAGSAIAPRSVRCELARARVLRTLGRDEAADRSLDAAEERAGWCEDGGDLDALVQAERRKHS